MWENVRVTYSYVDFETRFRGDSGAVADEQRTWLPFFADAPGPVVDLGCGRGEFLALLGEAGVPCWGVDLSPEMAAAARVRGADVREEPLLAHLEGLAPASLGGIFMAHVIEHLPRPDVLTVIALASSRLRPGAGIVIETLNPQCVFAHGPFTMDLTHEWPIHPQTLRFLLEAHGFVDIVPHYRQYLPDDVLAVASPALEQAVTPFERAVSVAMGKLQTIVDLAFKNFIYTMAARKPSPAR